MILNDSTNLVPIFFIFRRICTMQVSTKLFHQDTFSKESTTASRLPLPSNVVPNIFTGPLKLLMVTSPVFCHPPGISSHCVTVLTSFSCHMYLPLASAGENTNNRTVGFVQMAGGGRGTKEAVVHIRLRHNDSRYR